MEDNPGTKTNVILLGWTQEYLRTVLAEGNPDSVLAAAWDEFYRVYDGLMRRFAMARGLVGADVDDCVQAVWMQIASSLGEFEHPESHAGLRSWLYTLVRSRAGDLLRRKSRRPAESLDRARDAGYEPADPVADPGRQLEKEWEHALLETLLDELRQEISEINWRLLKMRCLEGREVPVVASELGLSSEQVWYRQRRLLKKLRARVAVFTGQSFAADEDDPGEPGDME